MIWIALIAALVVCAGAWFGAKTMRTRAVVLVAGLAAVGTYWFTGHPDMPDEPLAMRLEQLEADIQSGRVSAETLGGDQIMALIQKRALDDPDNPEPHKYMGDLMEAVGRPDEAILAYQSALRRDPAYRPAIRSLADLLFRRSGRVDPAAAELYREAFRLDPTDLRMAYMAGIGDWQAGRKEQAEAVWNEIEAQTPEGDPRAQMFKALRETFAVDEPPAPPAE